jgi:threonine/homoserine/homoserine lactone efflux protein
MDPDVILRRIHELELEVQKLKASLAKRAALAKRTTIPLSIDTYKADVAAAALGLAILLGSAPEAIVVVQLVGAGYLGWLSVGALRGHGGPTTVPSDRRLLWRAVLTNLTNPKVIVFFAAFLPQFTRPGHGPVAVQFAILGLLFLLVGLLSDSLIGVSAGRLGAALAPSGRATRILNAISAATFAVLAVALLWDALRR